MLNSIPLFTALIGTLFLAVIVVNRGAIRQNKPASFILMAIVLLAIHSQVDAYLYYNGWEGTWVGLSWLHYHLMGGLFLFFTRYLLGVSINARFWILLLAGFTVVRVLFLIPEDPAVYENYSDEFGWTDFGLILDNFASNGLNIAALYLAFQKIKNLQFAIKPEGKDRVSYLWLRGILAFQIRLYVVLVLLTVLSFLFAEYWLTFWKVESVVSGFFFFVLAFFAIRFPIFSAHGDFKDLQQAEKKYAKSSLTQDDSGRLWQQINQLMEEKKLYLDPEFRLTDLAARMEQSVHHISQVINQEKGGSFSDFLNALRVQEAQALLRSDKAKQLTILAIALEAGFNSKTAFYNAFKKFTGQTPSQFMKDLG